MEDKIQSKLKKWAKGAYDFYYPKAKELDIDFYTQSDLTIISEKKNCTFNGNRNQPWLGWKF